MRPKAPLYEPSSGKITTKKSGLFSMIEVLIYGIVSYYQLPFQEPKLEVPTIYKAYVRPKFQGISPQNMALYGTVPPI
jgi:multidrug efflux pump subunit AcrB